MSAENELPLAEQRARLERRANVIRSRLLRTIDALDTRRHQVTELGHQAKRVAVPLAATVAGVTVAAFGVTFAIARLVKRRRARRLEVRASQLVRTIRGFRVEKKPSLLEETLRRVTLTVVTIAATEAAKRVSKNFIDGRVPSGRLVVGKVQDGGQSHLVTR